MQRKEVNDRSPLRLLESSIRGGLGRGNIGVMIARHGVGKTAFLVGVALDDLMRGQSVLHVSLEHPVAKVREYYDELFTELAHHRGLQDVWKVRLDVERHRRIHSYLGNAFAIDKLRDVLGFMERHGDFRPSAIMIDGFDFAAASPDDLRLFRDIAREADAEMWMTAVTHREAERNDRGIPEPVAHLEPEIDVVLTMAHDGKKGVHLTLRKDHDAAEVPDLKLALDPTTMLLVRE